MAAATRIDDVCTGHGCFPPRKALYGSEDVFIQNRGAVRKTEEDLWETHCCTIVCHDAVAVEGSTTVFINNKAAVRIGDMLSCGSASAEGSPNVFFG
jgi:uncharacterized Zn-binding protein involved in type VI secretion